MKKLTFLVIVAVMAMMVSCNKETEQTEAQVQNPEEKEKIEQELPEALQTLRMGNELALFGYENKSAEALIEAANILSNVVVSDLTAQVKRGDAQGTVAEKDAEAKSFKPSDLLAAAKELAGEDAVLMAAIQKVENKLSAEVSGEEDASRGATTGAAVMKDRVGANTDNEIELEFQANVLAACTVMGDGTTDLDLYVYDEDGKLVTSDTDYSDQCYCSWIPKVTGKYTIRILNRGNVYNDYTFAVN